MTFKFSCPHCGQHISVEPSQAGSRGECPTCARPIIVPEYKPPRSPLRAIPPPPSLPNSPQHTETSPSLIICPACHRQVSRAAANCPGCGQPIKRGFLAAFSEAVEQTRIQMNRPEEIARRKRTQREFWILMAVVAVLFFCFMRVVERDNAKSSSTYSSSTTSAAWNIGYRDGQVAGRADAQQRNAKMGFSTRRSESTRHSAPLAPTGLSRKDYEDGWSVGYSSGYDSYSK